MLGGLHPGVPRLDFIVGAVSMNETPDGRESKPCPVCGGSMVRAGDAAYYDQAAHYRTPVYSCHACDVLCREVEDRKLVSHYYAASYVRSENEEALWRGRMQFFRWVLSLVQRSAAGPGAEQSGPPRLLDFGCAYGHMLVVAREQGYEPIGVELNEDLVRQSREKGLVVYRRLDEVPEKVDIITAVDSLYCVPNPRALLAGIRDKLKPGGVVLLRITNRNRLARLRGRLWCRGDFSAIGDATVSYSLRGITRLLHSSGWQIRSVIPDYGKGKRLAAGKRLSYLAGYLLTLLLWKKHIMTPGIILIAKPAESGPRLA
jgi:SAM-dependent methyltransferase